MMFFFFSFVLLEENKERKDLSHPVHSDNCLIRPNGECVRERPAYIQRDYRYIYMFMCMLMRGTRQHSM